LRAELTVTQRLKIGRAFTPSAPIGETGMFAGRLNQIGRVIEAVAQKGQHAIVYGEQGTGKTSFVNVLDGILSDEESSVLSLRASAHSSDTYSSLWRKIFAETSFTGMGPGTRFGATTGSPFGSQLGPLDKDITPDDVRRLLERLAGGYLLIVIVDEFGRLNREVTSAFADTIKVLTDRAVAVTIILVGTADSAEGLIPAHASIERSLVQIPLPRMSRAEISEIATKGVKRLDMTIADDALLRIVLLAQGLPHFAQLLGYHGALNACANNARGIGIDHIRSATEKAVENTQSSIVTTYNKAVTSYRKDNMFKQVLLACALATTDDLGFFPAVAVCRPMSELMGKQYEIPSFARHLKEFAEMDRGRVLERVGKERKFRYRFRNPLMQPYVIMRGLSSERIGQETLRRLAETVNRSPDNDFQAGGL
jgi:Cdc6-like AAA superfamily ATPase